MMNFSSSLLFDAAFVLIFVISIILAAKRGAFKAISGIAGTVAGLIGGLLTIDNREYNSVTEKIVNRIVFALCAYKALYHFSVSISKLTKMIVKRTEGIRRKSNTKMLDNRH